MDEEVGDLARRWQEALQVYCVVAGEAEASRRDDGRAEPQALFDTGRVKGVKLGEIDNDIYTEGLKREEGSTNTSMLGSMDV